MEQEQGAALLGKLRVVVGVFCLCPLQASALVSPGMSGENNKAKGNQDILTE